MRNTGLEEAQAGKKIAGTNINNLRYADVLSHFSHVRLFVTLWTVAHQAPLSIGFSRQKYWSRLPCPPPGDIPNPGIKLIPFMPPALAGWFFTTSITWEAPKVLVARWCPPHGL